MADRNKTELTQNITRNCALWMDAKGFKPVETEIYVADGWIADVAGIIEPTMTELINLKLLKNRPSYRRGRSDYSEPTPEFFARQEEWQKKLDNLSTPLTALIEVKASVSDFRNDRKWKLPPPTNLYFIAMPEGMIDVAEWPIGWGIILFNQSGENVRRFFPPICVDVPPVNNFSTVLSLAISRDHKTRYARVREWQKKIRLDEVDRKTIARIGSAIEFIKHVLDGKTVDEAKMFSSIRCELPGYILEAIQKLKLKIAKPEVPA